MLAFVEVGVYPGLQMTQSLCLWEVYEEQLDIVSGLIV